MNKKRLLVVGGNGAGLSAASQARRLEPELSILVLERSCDISFAACGFPHYLAGTVKDFSSLFMLTPAYLEEKRQIKVALETEVTAILPRESRLLVRERGKTEYSLSYDKLVLATGARAVLPGGFEAEEGVLGLRSAGDARAIDLYLKENSPASVLVVGASYLGLELAEAFNRRGLQVTVLEALPQVLPGFCPEIADYVESEFKKRGVKIIKNQRLSRIVREGKQKWVELPETGRVAFDLVLFSIGVKPEVALARQAGIALGKSGALLTSRRMQTSQPGIFACGDCAEYNNLVTQRGVFFPQGSAANRSGRVAGAVAAGGEDEFAGVALNLALKLFDLELCRLGLTLGEAEREFPGVLVHQARHSSRAAYYPGGSPVFIYLIFDRNFKLLGAELMGFEGVAKRGDILAAALSAGLSLKEIAKLDLNYFPAFAPVWDPVIYAAGEAVFKNQNV